MAEEQDFGATATFDHIQKKDQSKATGSCCGLFGRRKPKGFQQVLVLLRHSERKDYVDKTYKDSEEGKAWPHDAPLTSAGWALAKEHAEDLAALHDQYRFAAVSTSPYRRCMETAAVVALRLKLPIIIDQEMGEIWDKKMGDTKLPWRSSLELRQMAKDLKMKKIANPILEDGSFKLFGKIPTFPETLQAGRQRYLVRTEHYIQRSHQLKQNFILVGHADAVAACCDMFERGCAEISKMEFCARIVAKKLKIPGSDSGDEADGDDLKATSSYAQKWEVQMKGITVNEFTPESKSMVKYQESMHMDNCQDVSKQTAKRNDKRTKTDFMFDDKLKTLLSGMETESQGDDDWEAEEEKHKQPHSKSV